MTCSFCGGSDGGYTRSMSGDKTYCRGCYSTHGVQERNVWLDAQELSAQATIIEMHQAGATKEEIRRRFPGRPEWLIDRDIAR